MGVEIDGQTKTPRFAEDVERYFNNVTILKLYYYTIAKFKTCNNNFTKKKFIRKWVNNRSQVFKMCLKKRIHVCLEYSYLELNLLKSNLLLGSCGICNFFQQKFKLPQY